MGVATQAQVDDLVIGGRKLKANEYIAMVESSFVKNVTDAMNQLGIKLVDELAKNAPASSGSLASSFSVLGVRETKTGFRLEINIGADHGDFVDKGVRGIKHDIKNKKVLKNKDGDFYQFRTYFMPLKALQSLEGWMNRKNMETTATNLINRNDEARTMLPQISTPVKRLAYFIKKYGIEASNYQGKSIEKVLPDFNIDIQEIGYNSLILKVSK